MIRQIEWEDDELLRKRVFSSSLNSDLAKKEQHSISEVKG